ncbi:hypothetical protein [Pseudoalteromonas sp. T1lg23B]|uniref:hypothetical protein n=1 Tax=Pseudoalteromonas sp. T1lg23B TaxID=2077097 RepID=UPI000CF63F88|nr:hypothetical protein [Pseudoalteromonas sp. T1lg23B]
MKKLTSIALILTFSVVAGTGIPGVKKLSKEKNSSHKVECVNGATGFISREETNICAYSKGNLKNRCDTEDNWSIEAAAEYICN